MALSGLRTIIALSFILAIGFLLVILSAALWKNYLTLLVVLTFILAPIPNWLCERASSYDDLVDGNGTGIIDFGRLLTGFLVVAGIALPVTFSHCDLISTSAMIMSVVGGLLIYATIISFTMFFREDEDF